MATRIIKKRAFNLVIKDDDNVSGFTVEDSHNAEMIIRGMVHSGYEVTIKEIEIEKEVEINEKYMNVPNPAIGPVYLNQDGYTMADVRF